MRGLVGVLAVVVAVFVGLSLFGNLRRLARPESTPALGTLAEPDDVYDPVRAGEPLPAGFRQLLPRDAILPIYDPQFVTAEQTDWRDGTLVIGVEIEGEAKAYPVSHLNRREMVIDELGKMPILVTW